MKKFIISIMIISFFSCKNNSIKNEKKSDSANVKSNTSNSYDSISINLHLNDTINKKEYEAIKIGNQIWLKENFDGTVFQNGDKIKFAKTAAEWNAAALKKIPAWCYPDSVSAISKGLGKIYNWYAVNDKRGLAPKGWHIPTQSDFEVLDSFVEKSTGFLSGFALKAQFGWPNETNGNDIVSFSAIPVNIRKYSGKFSKENYPADFSKNIDASWWTSDATNELPFSYGKLTEKEILAVAKKDDAYNLQNRKHYTINDLGLLAIQFNITYNTTGFWNESLDKGAGCSIRLIKN